MMTADALCTYYSSGVSEEDPLLSLSRSQDSTAIYHFNDSTFGRMSSNQQEKRKREIEAITLDQFHESLQQLPLTLPQQYNNGSVVMYSERAVQALKMAHQLFLQVVAAELAQQEVTNCTLNESHAVTALSQVGFSELCTRAQAVVARDVHNNLTETVASTTTTEIATTTTSSAATLSSDYGKKKKKRKKMKKKVITQEMEEEQARLLQQSVTMQQEKAK